MGKLAQGGAPNRSQQAPLHGLGAERPGLWPFRCYVLPYRWFALGISFGRYKNNDIPRNSTDPNTGSKQNESTTEKTKPP